mmetsp:Transcript_34430/g.57467  ORF Transcript_34430/g.57467 Transcript_34430/m.57467 type:complete len:252 (+) Transcript_34430:135-890(+)
MNSSVFSKIRGWTVHSGLVTSWYRSWRTPDRARVCLTMASCPKFSSRNMATPKGYWCPPSLHTISSSIPAIASELSIVQMALGRVDALHRTPRPAIVKPWSGTCAASFWAIACSSCDMSFRSCTDTSIACISARPAEGGSSRLPSSGIDFSALFTASCVAASNLSSRQRDRTLRTPRPTSCSAMSGPPRVTTTKSRASSRTIGSFSQWVYRKSARYTRSGRCCSSRAAAGLLMPRVSSRCSASRTRASFSR